MPAQCHVALMSDTHDDDEDEDEDEDTDGEYLSAETYGEGGRSEGVTDLGIKRNADG